MWREPLRKAFYETLDGLGEAEVDRRVHDPPDDRIWTFDEHKWARAWLREQKANKEDRSLNAAETSARSSKVAARWAVVAALVAAAAIAWNVWGS